MYKRQPYTPTWQEKITGVKADIAIATAREFADNAEKTKGRSMIIMGGGINHWYHADVIYRTILNLIMFCGTEGVNGGGWAHYVGQEKLRPIEEMCIRDRYKVISIQPTYSLMKKH